MQGARRPKHARARVIISAVSVSIVYAAHARAPLAPAKRDGPRGARGGGGRAPAPARGPAAPPAGARALRRSGGAGRPRGRGRRGLGIEARGQERRRRRAANRTAGCAAGGSRGARHAEGTDEQSVHRATGRRGARWDRAQRLCGPRRPGGGGGTTGDPIRSIATETGGTEGVVECAPAAGARRRGVAAAAAPGALHARVPRTRGVVVLLLLPLLHARRTGVGSSRDACSGYARAPPGARPPAGGRRGAVGAVPAGAAPGGFAVSCCGGVVLYRVG